MSGINEVNEQGLNDAIAAGSPVLIDFFTPSCRPCKAMQPVLEQLARNMEGKLALVKVNAEAEPAVVGRYGVAGVPTLILLRSGGQEAGRRSGYVTGSELKNWLEAALA